MSVIVIWTFVVNLSVLFLYVFFTVLVYRVKDNLISKSKQRSSIQKLVLNVCLDII